MTHENMSAFQNAFSDGEMAELFSGFPDSPTQPTTEKTEILPSEWTVDEPPNSTGKSFIFRNGLSRVDFEQQKSFDTLKWDANIPEVLLPGISAKTFTAGFEPLVFYNLVRSCGMPSSLDQTDMISKYRERSTASIKYYQGPDESYKLGIRDEYLQFILDFCRNSDPLKGITIQAKQSSQEYDFMLRVNYGERDKEKGIIALVIPERMRKYRPINPELMKFVLNTHKDREDLTTSKNAYQDFSEFLRKSIAEPKE